ncbi:MAG: competence protein ComGC [Erysipelotrichaceae bacterium]|nr:competence protein ComGC [Erysipelotrichaceae bacterium]
MKGFTVLEMILVLTIIMIVFMITLPNIQQKRDIVNNKGCDVLVEVVNSQILMYQLETGETDVSMDDLIREGYLKESQRKCPNGKEIVIYDNEAKQQ